MKFYPHSHQGADAILTGPERTEIEDAIEQCEHSPARGVAPKIRQSIVRYLSQRGWSDEFPVEPTASKITIASVKNRVGLCLQTGGNMSRMYADLLKLQKLYLEETISVGAIVLPTAPAARDLGENLANADRLQSELVIFRKVIHMPISIYGFE